MITMSDIIQICILQYEEGDCGAMNPVDSVNAYCHILRQFLLFYCFSPQICGGGIFFQKETTNFLKNTLHAQSAF